MGSRAAERRDTRARWRHGRITALLCAALIGTQLVGVTGTRALNIDIRIARYAPPAPRVLLMGDSIMDQQGSHAAFLLRQAGIDAQADGLWGSSLLTPDQYDYGHTIPPTTTGWLERAKEHITTFNPQIVAVYLNHNYWPPHPHDAQGRLIDDLWSPAGQSMIGTQAAALIRILRSRGAQVYFVLPVLPAYLTNPDPNVWNPVWHAYLPVLSWLHVPVIDSASPLRDSQGRRIEQAPTCDNTTHWLRPQPDNLHLTRLGAGRAGTKLALYIAGLLHVSLRGNNAPGERTIALVPTSDGHGYWLVACDGSVYHFGNAIALPASPVNARLHGGVVGAAATTDNHGLWLVYADGTIATIGDAIPMTFSSRPQYSISGIARTPDGTGLWATDVVGNVYTAGTATNYGSVPTDPPHGFVSAIAATPSGHGYWIVSVDGQVSHFGDACDCGSETSPRWPITGITSAPDGAGYWLVSSDGTAHPHGDAHHLGNATQRTPLPGFMFYGGDAPGRIVAAPGPAHGYWIIDDYGRVWNFGSAIGRVGDNNLALFTD